MSRRSVAAIVIASTLASLPGCAAFQWCSKDTTNECSPPPPGSREDHDTVLILTGVVVTAIVVGIIALNRADPHDDTMPPARTAIAPAPADARARYVAPMPAGVADEGEQLRLQRMYVQGQVLARAGRCDGAQAIGRQIARTSRDYYATYAAEPAIASCGRTL